MATYKLIQDIEAEDHILGPLTLRQFIFALVGAFCWYLSFIFFVKHVYVLLIVSLPPALFCTFFAIPFGRDQPTEVWALAKLRFLFKPRRRIWDQSGVKELVTITVPKRVERVLTKGFSQTEVQSRLKALANTLDTRGWAIKNVDASNRFNQGQSDRLIDIGLAPQEVPNYDAQASDDILDVTSSPVAQQFQNMIDRSTQQHRQHVIDEMNAAQTQPVAAPAGQTAGWFMKPTVATQAAGPAPAPTPVPAAAAAPLPTLPPKPAGQTLAYSHLRTLQPMGQDNGGQPQSGTTPADPAILSLANNNDLNVSTIARQAYKAKHGDEPPQDEVVVSLH